jgi:Rieske Fe-S protein
MSERTEITRRAALGCACGLGVAAVAGGCAVYGGSSGGENEGEKGDAKDGSGKPAAGAGPLAKTSDIPVGGGKIFKARKVVVTQPSAGEFKAFSAICTHQGCTVSEIANGIITCTCHNSQFRIADGSVADGPAPSPLPPVKITVTGDSISL